MTSKRTALRSARGAISSCALAFLCLSAGCGVPEYVSPWYEDAPPPVCTTDDDCDDSDQCTTDKCVDNACIKTSVTFDDGDKCTTDSCDPQGGVSNIPVSIDDNDACTFDACDPQTGVSHTPLDPSIYADNDACTVDTCDPQTGPVHTPIDPATYDDNDLCTVDTCDPAAGPVHTPVDPSTYDDNDLCTADSCDPMNGPTYVAVPIDDSNGCTADACDPLTGVSHTPNVICPQQVSEDCGFKLCVPATGACAYFDPAFQEEFADNSKGWALDLQWQIGTAAASGGQMFGNPDPEEDYDGSLSGDNGVAGVALGGNAMSTSGTKYYLTSPEIDLSSLPASETVFLDFWRWLNTAGPMTMQNTIEVYNGTSWVQVWASVGPLADNVWNNVSYDITPHKNAKLRVRFGFSVANGAPAASSWNIDHVRLIRNIDQGC
jgi:hypothetical protein